MANINGITLTPDTETGSKTLTISAQEYLGRVNRSAKFTAANSSLNITSNSLVVTQKGHEIFNVVSETINSGVASVTLNGKTNLKSIQTTGNGTLWNYLSTANINGVTVTKAQLSSGYTVPEDPGKSDEYDVSFSFENIPENVEDVTYSGNINNSSAMLLTVTKSGTGVQDIWFSSTQNGDKTTDNVIVALTADGQITQGSAYVRTDPSDLSWTVTARQNS